MGRPSLTEAPAIAGILAGLLAVLSWGAYLALARAGVNQGLHLADFLLLRFGVAAVVMLPFMPFRWTAMRALGWRRALIITLLTGPLFVVMAIGGYRFAPLAHGAVIQPTTVTVSVTLAAVWLLHETLTTRRLLGVAMAIAGIAMVALGAPASAHGGAQTWIGDLLFVGAGLLWAGFTLLLRQWRLDPVLATALVAIIAAIPVVPAFFLFSTLDRLLALPPTALVLQVLVQGVLSGVIALVAFGYAVRRMGAGAAAMFPSMVPVAATLIGLPITHEVPAPLQIAGLACASLGLLVSLRPARP